MRLLLPILLIAGALSGGLYAELRFAEPREIVRTVDMQRCLQGLPEVEAELRAIQDKYRSRAERLQERADRLKAQKGELSQLDPESEEFRVRDYELRLEEEVMKKQAEFWQQRQLEERDALLDRTVRRIHEACAELGAREGYSAVLMRPGEFLPADRVQDSLRDLEMRWVVWAHPDHDVTDQVLEILTADG